MACRAAQPCRCIACAPFASTVEDHVCELDPLVSAVNAAVRMRRFRWLVIFYAVCTVFIALVDLWKQRFPYHLLGTISALSLCFTYMMIKRMR